MKKLVNYLLQAGADTSVPRWVRDSEGTWKQVNIVKLAMGHPKVGMIIREHLIKTGRSQQLGGYPGDANISPGANHYNDDSTFHFIHKYSFFHNHLKGNKIQIRNLKSPFFFL